MPREEKTDFLARLFMCGAKLGYNADITQIEYFIQLVALSHTAVADGVRPSEFISLEHDGLAMPDDEAVAKIKSQILSENPCLD